jgi:hypothetical protein
VTTLREYLEAGADPDVRDEPEGTLAREEYTVPYAADAEYVQKARFTPANQ